MLRNRVQVKYVSAMFPDCCSLFSQMLLKLTKFVRFSTQKQTVSNEIPYALTFHECLLSSLLMALRSDTHALRHPLLCQHFF